MWDLKVRVSGLGFRDQGWEFGRQISGFKIRVERCRVEGEG